MLIERRDERDASMDGPNVWIIVCENFHGAVGPIPTQALARDLAVAASEAGECNYQPVQLALGIGSGAESVGDDRVREATGSMDPTASAATAARLMSIDNSNVGERRRP